ncbi:carboxypeptidase-like regulatory domain-containing protein [Larkinella harenae]
MKQVLVMMALLSTVACTEPGVDGPQESGKPEEGVVKGRVVDEQGKPVANAVIVASSTDYGSRTSTGYTDANGNYSFRVTTGIAAGSYTASGSVTVKYHNQNYSLALYEENTRVFSAYDGAVRNFIFRLTGKRTVDADVNDRPLGAKLEVHHNVDAIEKENLEIILEPVGPLVDGSTGKKLVVGLPENRYYVDDIPVGQYKISARDKTTGKALGVSVHNSFKKHEPSVTALFQEENGATTFYDLVITVDTL